MDYSEQARRKRGKRRKKHYLLKTLITILVLYGLYRLAMSPLFSVKSVEVENATTHYTAEQILEISGVVMGSNIFKTKTGELKGNLESDPYIRSARVERRLPDGVRIEVEERTEDMLIQTEDGQYAVINYDGMILRFCGEGELPTLPIAAGLTPIDPEPGKALKVQEADLLKPAIDFFQKVQEEDFFFKKLDVGGVVTKAYILDRLLCEGDLKNIENNIPAIRKVAYDLTSKGIERGTISVSGTGTCSFTPEVGEQTPDTVEAEEAETDAGAEAAEEGENGESESPVV
ncbi:MAG: FtsQ-type POTRA domain-containing protein [Clostridiales Family XIII bacterium]|jgi:cell division protein FtsQ|nr:FtsQ-type POTRA domain-containing protein [Clostridiales Family XIII bacterium]